MQLGAKTVLIFNPRSHKQDAGRPVYFCMLPTLPRDKATGKNGTLSVSVRTRKNAAAWAHASHPFRSTTPQTKTCLWGPRSRGMDGAQVGVGGVYAFYKEENRKRWSYFFPLSLKFSAT